MEKTFTVEKEQSAKALGSGTLMVLGTPALVAMVENTAMAEIAAKLNPGETTVGVKVEMDHLKASKIGAEVVVKTTCIKEGKKSFSFEYEVFSQGEKLAAGQHIRVRVTEKTFLENL